jgi:hypothetical protein
MNEHDEIDTSWITYEPQPSGWRLLLLAAPHIAAMVLLVTLAAGTILLLVTA